MTQKVYKTAQGKTVDLGALMLQNENTRAVGNMKVNARGDLLDGWNRPIDRRTQQVQKQYDRQVTTTNVRDEPVVTSVASTRTAAPAGAPQKSAPVVSKPEPVAKAAAPAATNPVAEDTPSSGLAAAIARARRITQEPVISPQQESKKKPGVNKI